ncbi:hypothetical protein Q1695_010087 [Nippostrongylus brasiliensis]|nr:hypothetical protein Q1695_010087 [Nippostrongylus brasiliensis]
MRNDWSPSTTWFRMSLPFEPLPQGRVVEVPVPLNRFPLPPKDDEVLIRAGKNNFGLLKVIEWDHMDLSLFYPAALTSTWTVRTVLYPLAVLRSRLQLQKQHTVYRSTLHAFASISRREGIRGLYRGFWVTVPQIGCSFIYSTVYEKLRAVLNQDYNMRSVAGISSIAGGAASFASQLIFVPTDIVAQYMMVYYRADKFISGNDKAIIEYVRGEQNTRLTLGMRFLRAIYKVDGLFGFYRGFWASSLVYVPSCLTFWPVYYWCQDFFNYMRRRNVKKDDGPLLLDQAVAATFGGACSTIVTNPMEMFRIRLQVHRTSYMDTWERMLRNEKHHMFTKGLAPRLLSNSTYSCVVMVGYEIVKRFCVLPEYKDRVKW